MANNRMNLVNTATKQRVLLAAHFATKWRALSGIEDDLWTVGRARRAKLRPSPLMARSPHATRECYTRRPGSSP